MCVCVCVCVDTRRPEENIMHVDGLFPVFREEMCVREELGHVFRTDTSSLQTDRERRSHERTARCKEKSTIATVCTQRENPTVTGLHRRAATAEVSGRAASEHTGETVSCCGDNTRLSLSAHTREPHARTHTCARAHGDDRLCLCSDALGRPSLPMLLSDG